MLISFKWGLVHEHPEVTVIDNVANNKMVSRPATCQPVCIVHHGEAFWYPCTLRHSKFWSVSICEHPLSLPCNACQTGTALLQITVSLIQTAVSPATTDGGRWYA